MDYLKYFDVGYRPFMDLFNAGGAGPRADGLFMENACAQIIF